MPSSLTLHCEHDGRVWLPPVVEQAEVGARVLGPNRGEGEAVSLKVQVSPPLLSHAAPLGQLVVVAQESGKQERYIRTPAARILKRFCKKVI